MEHRHGAVAWSYGGMRRVVLVPTRVAPSRRGSGLEASGVVCEEPIFVEPDGRGGVDAVDHLEQRVAGVSSMPHKTSVSCSKVRRQAGEVPSLEHLGAKTWAQGSVRGCGGPRMQSPSTTAAVEYT
jgi:hypothetical protein